MVFTGMDGLTDNVAGAGPVETFAQVYDSMGRAQEGDFLEIGLNLGPAGLDVLGTVLDPVGSLATAGIGWLIEHLSFLREPLDWFAGSPDNIKGACQTWNEVAMQLDDIGKQQDAALQSQAQSWEKQAAEAFRKSHGQLGEEIRAVGIASTAVSEEIASFGTMVATIRGMIRDLISTFIYEVIRNAVIALAGSAATFGAAAAAFAAWAVGRGAMVLGKITKHVTSAMQVASKVLGRLKGLFGQLGDLLPGLKRFGKGSGSADTPAPTSPASTPDAPSKPSAGQRLEDWGRQKADDSDVKQKANEAFSTYKNAGNRWNEIYEEPYQSRLEDFRAGRASLRGEGATDAYSPYKPTENADGTVSAHSSPSFSDGSFQLKFAGDLSRELTKSDELENEVPEQQHGNEEQKKAAKEADQQHVENLRAQRTE